LGWVALERRPHFRQLECFQSFSPFTNSGKKIYIATPWGVWVLPIMVSRIRQKNFPSRQKLKCDRFTAEDRTIASVVVALYTEEG
jgi:hypothetical protein